MPEYKNENSLAAYDHSFTAFHTNHYQPYLNFENSDQQQSSAHTHTTSSHRRVGAKRPQLYQPYRETSWNFSSPREYGLTHDILREHRRRLAAADLLPRAFTPPTPNSHLSPLHLASLTFSSTASGGSSIRAVGPAGPSGGPTSLPPLCGGVQTECQRFVPAPHLIRGRRPSAAVLNRQRTLGAVIITAGGLCPPFLLLVGSGKSHLTALTLLSKANARIRGDGPHHGFGHERGGGGLHGSPEAGGFVAGGGRHPRRGARRHQRLHLPRAPFLEHEVDAGRAVRRMASA